MLNILLVVAVVVESPVIALLNQTTKLVVKPWRDLHHHSTNASRSHWTSKTRMRSPRTKRRSMRSTPLRPCRR